MKIIGHRGACGLAPENTIVSLQKALQHNVWAVEFDLRVTKDGVVVLHHDKELVDPAGNQLSVAETTYDELKKHKADLATFEEVLDEFGHPVVLYVEVKPHVDVKPIARAIRQRLDAGWQPDWFRLESFSLPVLLELQAALPEIQKTVLERWSGVRATRRARKIGTKHIIMKQKWLWWGFIRQMSRAGYKLGTYTLNDPAKARRWARHGLTAVVTDYPDRY